MAGLAGVALASSGCTPAAPPPTPPPVALSATPTATLAGRAVHTATPLADGSVLVAGGCDIDGCGRATASTFLLTAAGERPAAPLTQARDGHTATPLADGRVLVVGGYAAENTPPLATAEIFDPASGRWAPTAPLRVARGGHASARLGDGRVLVTGGWTGRGATAGTEIFDPATGTWAAGPDLPGVVDGHSAVELADGGVLVAGGRPSPRSRRPPQWWSARTAGSDRSARCARAASSTRCCPGPATRCWSSAAPATTGPCCGAPRSSTRGQARSGPALAW